MLYFLRADIAMEVDEKDEFAMPSNSGGMPILSRSSTPLKIIKMDDENFEKLLRGSKDEYLLVM